jgi:predicted nuclease with TOPRIM domain
MARKILIGFLVAICFILSSCYPELSVQQYDRLKEDLLELDEQRQELSRELIAVREELDEIKAKNQEIREYVNFLVQLVATQSSEGLLEGKFDTESLAEAKENLLSTAENLEDGNITYYLGLIDPDNESQTIAVYYKAIEYCLKNIKSQLE